MFCFISSNVGVKMVKYSSSTPVKAKEVLAVGQQPVLGIETALITLAHLAVHGEDVEVEVSSCYNLYFVHQDHMLLCPV
jgi:hypothetical protein